MLYAVLAQMHEDGVHMGEDVKHAYANSAQNIDESHICIEQRRDVEKKC